MAELDTFVIELGRAAKRALRLLRGLNATDRDDVLAAAILYAWEDRANVGSDVDIWFRDHVRQARKEFPTNHHSGQHELARMAAAEDTEREAALIELTERISADVDEADKPMLELYAQGFSVSEIAGRIQATPTFVRRRLRSVRNRIGPMRKWLPDLPRTLATPVSQVSAPEDDAAAPPIDHAIEKMLRRPKTPRADCPVCWRCSWFDGLAPHKHLVLESVVDKRKRQIALTGRCE